MKKPTVFIDMDGPLADFEGNFRFKEHGFAASEMPGAYRNLDYASGARRHLALLRDMASIWIVTRPDLINYYSLIEKQQWIEEHFFELADRMIYTQDKSLLCGDVLIDDHPEWADCHNFQGKLIHFKNWRQAFEEFSDWYENEWKVNS